MLCVFNSPASANINVSRLICSWTCVLLFKTVVAFIMNKVLRDSETQLKGTTLFVICAFQLNNFWAPRSPNSILFTFVSRWKKHKKKNHLCYIMTSCIELDVSTDVTDPFSHCDGLSTVLAGISHYSCSLFDVIIIFSLYARAVRKSASHIYRRCQHIVVIRCSFFSGEETGTPVYCFHLVFRSDITCLLNNRKLTSVLSQRYPCCVGTCLTYAKKSLLPLIFLCPAIRTVFPHAVGTLQDKK